MFSPGIKWLRRTTRGLPFFCLFVASAWAAPTKLGDLNSDGIIDVFDLTRLREHIRKADPLPQNLIPFADLTEDGFLNEDDALALINVIIERDPAKSLPLASIRETSPFAGENSVALTREVILRFTMPLALDATLTTWDFNTQTPGNFYAEGGGRKLLTRVELSGDRLKATLFFLEPVPASTRVAVTFNGSGIKDLLSRAIDPEGDGGAGGVFTFTFDTAPITPVIGTGIIGHVYASEKGPNGSNVPLPGALVRVVGSETLFTFTAADGSFSLNPCPAGRFFVEVDGRTSGLSNFPDGGYYPYINKPWEALPGKANNLAAGTGLIYLPLVPANTLQPVSAVEETRIAFAPEVVAANPALAGVEIYVPPNSLFADDGTRGGRVGLAPVASDRLPEPLPPGLNHALDISIQTDGATNFDRPVPVRFPNLPDPVTGIKLQPGEKSALWSYNHDKGAWEIAGPMTVTEDGNFVVTDAGVGVRQPGWHGSMPGSQGDGGAGDACQGLQDEYAKASNELNDQMDDLYGVVSGYTDPIDVAYEEAKRLAEAKFKGRGRFRHGKSLGKMFKVLDAEQKTKQVIECIRDINDDNSSTWQALIDRPCRTVAIETATSLSDDVITGFGKARGLVFDLGLQAGNLWFDIWNFNNQAEKAQNAFDAWMVCVQAQGGTNQDSPLLRTRGVTGANLGKTFSDSAIQDTYEALQRATLAFQRAADEVLTQRLKREQLDQRLKEIQRLSEKLVSAEDNPAKPTLTNHELRQLFVQTDESITTLRYFQNRPAVMALIEDAYDTLDELNAKMSSHLRLGDHHEQSERAPLYVLLKTGEFSQRFQTTNAGTFSRVLTPESAFSLRFLSPTDGGVGTVVFFSSQMGGIRQIPFVPLSTDESPDDDGDGLSNDAETIVGTNSQLRDTDLDGVLDGAEIRQGTNPLDNLPTQTGVVASLDTPGHAKDIAAQNTVAVLADGSEGVSVFNVANALNPVRTAQVRLTGSTESVALDGTLAAATGSSLSLLDLSDLSAVRVTKQLFLGGTPRAVTAAGGVAYAGLDNGQVVAVDMAAGAELERLQVSTEPIHDLSFAGDVLYVRTPSKVYALELAAAGMSVSGSVAVNGSTNASRLRLVAGGGLAYAPYTNGYTILSLADPLHPAVAQTISTAQFGWRHVASTGSGLGLAIFANTGNGDLHLYDFGTNGQNSQFLTTFTTPGNSQAVSIYNGLAYVADGDAGLTVVNYVAYDNKGIPPTVSVKTSFITDGNGQLQAEEGKLGSFTAIVTDDVQVRNVEFYFDGQRVANVGGIPFEHRFICPLISPTKSSFTLRARAFDTGGNATWSEELNIKLAADATRPRVARYLPSEDGPFINRVSAFFSEPIAPSSVTSETFTLTEAGPDMLLGTADDQRITGESVTYREDLRAAVINLSANLPNGIYKATVSIGVTDLAGNALAPEVSWQFRVRPELAPIVWGEQNLDYRDFDQPFIKIAAGGSHTVALKNDGTVVAWGTSVPAGLSGVTAIAAGGSHTVALKNDGTVVAWGTSVPAGLSGVTAIAAGGSHTVALKNDGTVVAWGLNSYGQTNVPAGLSGVAAIAAGEYHNVALKNDGTVVAWGNNGNGQTSVPAGLSGVAAIAAGGSHTVALKNDGTVVAWGNNGSGRTSVPAGLSGVIAIAAGGAHTMALKNDGTVVAWGVNGNGQTSVPAGLSGVAAIAAGDYYSVALKNDGTVVAWGSERIGPTTLPAWPSGLSAIAVGFDHIVALKNNGTVVAWGSNWRGETTVPTGLSGVVAVAAGNSHSVALKNDGKVVAWGFGDYGQTSVPAGLNGVVAIDTKGYTTVALKNDGTVVAWGLNSQGQPAGLSGVTAIAAGYDHIVALKNDGTVVAWGYAGTGRTTVPAGLSGVVAIAAGEFHTLALKNDGTVVGWGLGSGRTVPVGLSGVTAVAASDHSLALKSDGTVVAWGPNFYGQATVPAGLSGVVAIAAGNYHSLALKNDGTVVAWGDNGNGQTTVPAGLSGVLAIAVGYSSSAVLVPLAPP